MLDTELSDDEKAEALKRWWTENGKSIIGGIVLGLALIFGWKAWNEYQVSQASEASAEYDRLQATLSRGDIETAQKQLQTLNVKYNRTNYDYFAALDLAKVYVLKDDLENARNQLENAIEVASDQALKELAQFRLARVLMALNKTKEAEQIVQQKAQSTFASEFSHIEGDLLSSKGKMKEASAAYQQALEGHASNRKLIEMKYNEVNHTVPAG